MKESMQLTMQSEIYKLKPGDSAWFVGDRFEASLCYGSDQIIIEIYYPVQKTATVKTLHDAWLYIFRSEYKND